LGDRAHEKKNGWWRGGIGKKYLKAPKPRRRKRKTISLQRKKVLRRGNLNPGSPKRFSLILGREVLKIVKIPAKTSPGKRNLDWKKALFWGGESGKSYVVNSKNSLWEKKTNISNRLKCRSSIPKGKTPEIPHRKIIGGTVAQCTALLKNPSPKRFLVGTMRTRRTPRLRRGTLKGRHPTK